MSWCDEYEAFLCEHCQESHDDMKITRSHAAVALENVKKSDVETASKNVYCKEHMDHALQLYDDTRKQCLCFKCYKAKHRSCKVEDIAAALGHLKDTVLEDEMRDLSEKIGAVDILKDHVCEVMELAEENEKKGHAFLKHTFTDLRNTLSQREDELLLQAHEIFKAVFDINSSRLSQLEIEKVKYKSA